MTTQTTACDEKAVFGFLSLCVISAAHAAPMHYTTKRGGLTAELVLNGSKSDYNLSSQEGIAELSHATVVKKGDSFIVTTHEDKQTCSVEVKVAGTEVASSHEVGGNCVSFHGAAVDFNF
ncbi:hypothetical protein GLI01_17760 [Gluconacetobacter liquefaciens]|uniref:Uncharacterized protein n=1 Tax=Gluconacetobacter liquefaciens TaxID=89584 RepID=A0A370GAI6_GLULI|nr:hypothetical protein [Gluconacetobacter liquefaciens]MBB2185302.1 hypothetical protein [Gluconacetobacter liquefaciens]RDI40741.1 hypothetical protein C7453_101540 [Gluconacetobacter liquefaciens]GBR03223.1 hypothetical protein AA0522_1725 [Gluconacetobacter liquefaciens NRIC 0522]GEB37741.1 hypothetical protein GLI01_17760 [Gluconacetobacter liquefaciens]